MEMLAKFGVILAKAIYIEMSTSPNKVSDWQEFLRSLIFNA